MLWHPTKDAVQRLWGRRWVRRVSYVLVAGASFLTIAPWVANRPPVVRWALGRLNAVVQDETGLPLTIGQVELRPTFGLLVLHEVSLGGDLLTVQRVEIQADLWSLLGTTHRINSLRIERPRLRLTEAGLSALRLKNRSPRTGPLPQFQLDLLSLTGCEIQVPVPLRGIPELQYQFEVKATGLGPNQIRVDLVGAQLSVKGPGGWEKGRLDLNGVASEKTLSLKEGYLRLGESQIHLSGRYEVDRLAATDRVVASVKGVLDLAQASRWQRPSRPYLAGILDVTGTLQGSMAQPAWTFTADGRDLRPETVDFQRGEGHQRVDHLGQHLINPSSLEARVDPKQHTQHHSN